MDTVIKNGSPAPDIQMTDLEGQQHTLADYAGKVVVLNFWSAECSWSERADKALKHMMETWEKDVVVLRVASNANETRQFLHNASRNRDVAPLILDPQQKIAKMFGAAITPQVFVFDRKGILRYQGAFDNANFRTPEATRNYLWEAVQAILDHEHPTPAATKAYGCTIVFDVED